MSGAHGPPDVTDAWRGDAGAPASCEECGNVLPPTGRFCGRCGRRRDHAAGIDELEHGARPTPPRSTLAWTMAAGLVLVGLLAAGAAWVLDGPTSDPATSRTSAPATRPADDGATASSRPRPVPVTDLPRDIQCTVGDVPTRPDGCATWALAVEEGSEFVGVTTDHFVVVASTAAGVTALEAVTGEVRWHWENVPALAQDIVLAGGRAILTLGTDHELVALDMESGAMVWSFPLVEQRQAWVAGGADGSETGTGWLAVREPTRLTVLDPVDGDIIFGAKLPAGGTSPVLAGPLVVAAGEGHLFAWDRVTGDPAWQTDIDVDPAVEVISAGGAVVATTGDGHVAAVDGDGTIRWRTELAGVMELVALQDGTIAAVSRSGARVLSLDSGAEVSRIAIAGRVHDAAPAGHGELLVATASNVQRIDSGLAGETWTLSTAPGAQRPRAVLANTGWTQYVVSTVHGGRFLASFEVLFTTPSHREDPTCPGAQPSEALGSFTTWQNDGAHVGLDFNPLSAASRSHLWLGLFDVSPSQPVTVTARALHDGATAELRHGQGWSTEATLHGGRTSPGWPTHWVTEARFPGAGCWEVEISTDDGARTVVISVPEDAVHPDR